MFTWWARAMPVSVLPKEVDGQQKVGYEGSNV
jgi:hypothetical protein